jgi:hypothetical protein
MLSAISVMPFMRRFQGPPRAKALNHKPTPHVNSLPAELIDGKFRIFAIGVLGQSGQISDGFVGGIIHD